MDKALVQHAQDDVDGHKAARRAAPRKRILEAGRRALKSRLKVAGMSISSAPVDSGIASPSEAQGARLKETVTEGNAHGD